MTRNSDDRVSLSTSNWIAAVILCMAITAGWIDVRVQLGELRRDVEWLKNPSPRTSTFRGTP